MSRYCSVQCSFAHILAGCIWKDDSSLCSCCGILQCAAASFRSWYGCNMRLENINATFQGADVNIQDCEGRTPLFWAVTPEAAISESNGEIIDMLLQHGAKTDILDKYRCTALSYARKLNNESAAKKLENYATEKADLSHIHEKVGSLRLELLQFSIEQAAIKIQSVYRGHRVRKVAYGFVHSITSVSKLK